MLVLPFAKLFPEDARLRREYYTRLIRVAKIPESLAREHTLRATIEVMRIYLSKGQA
jgi:hypothetical protein